LPPVISLRGANLQDVDLSQEQSGDTDRPFGTLVETTLHGADLTNANLEDANLEDASLDFADLSGADLEDASLTRLTTFTFADLKGANLRHAQGVTNERLEQEASTLQGATMPNGQKYEDWLKSKGTGEDGENSGSS
jgi:uncharacterized protein YjbI with pentapeptide repeats